MGNIEKYNESLTQEQRKQRASEAGKASGKARQQASAMREILLGYMNLPITSDKMQDFAKVKSLKDFSKMNKTVKEEIALALIMQSRKGDMNALKLLLQIIGEMPKEDINISMTPVVIKDDIESDADE